jgi:hypothetical protein
MSLNSKVQPLPLAGEGPAKPGERGLFRRGPSPGRCASTLSRKGRGLSELFK